jgi:hypothetical protein
MGFTISAESSYPAENEVDFFTLEDAQVRVVFEVKNGEAGDLAEFLRQSC